MPAREKTPKSAITITAAAAKLGSLGGKAGGPSRARKLPAGTRSAIASKGGKAKAAAARRSAGKRPK